MALSLRYLVFVHLLELVRLSCGGQEDLSIEIVMLRHGLRVAPPGGPACGLGAPEQCSPG